MSTTPSEAPLRLPATLELQLHGFRRRVWTVKMAEALCVAVFAVVVAFLSVFALDRVFDTPWWLRLGVFLAALCGCAIVPVYLHHWVWRRRHPEQLAQLLSDKLPHLGDHLLGVIELVRSEAEQARSRALCEAAVRQVADAAETHNLNEAAPNSRYRIWGFLAAVSLATAIGLAVLFPSAAGNAWTRFLAPWGATPRYTFAAVESLPGQLVVAHGERFNITVRLAEDSLWRPPQGQVRLGQQQPVEATLRDDCYTFELPAQIDAGRLDVMIGDARHHVEIKPVLRPELTAILAEVALPEYLGLPKALKKDARGGSISLVKGSRATFVATASRDLASASVDGQLQTPTATTIRSPNTGIDGTQQIEFRWEDEFGLAGKEPFTLTVSGCDDEPPSLACEDLPRSKVVLDSEQLSFHVKTHDDFGVQHVGLQWQGLENSLIDAPAGGERILAAGGCDQVSVDATGTFSAQALGIQPQPIHLRVFAEDYFPGRQRVYSPTYVLYVLNAEQHAIWMTEQLSKWHRQSLEVRDREMQLYETNKQLRDLSPEELDLAETRRRVENQAAAERANGRRLSNLVASGEELVRQASRNPEFGVGHLERWAEMLQILEDISNSRMPSVADLLDQASKAKSVATGTSSDPSPQAGQALASGSGSGPPAEDPSDQTPKTPPVPQVVDVESTQQPPDDESQGQASDSPPGAPSLGLPMTALIGGGANADENASCPTGQKIDEAVSQQQDLLAEFEKIANELNNILANLEGSTLVKRLKAASREQYRIGGGISDQLDDSFGLQPVPSDDHQKEVFGELSDLEANGSLNASLIMDDMQAYFERRQFTKFKTVLEDMKAQDIVGGLRQLSEDIPEEQGLSIAQCDYWSDSLDRWAEDLVDPASGGT